MKKNNTRMIIFSTDINSVVEEIVRKEPLITESKIDKVKELIESNFLRVYSIVYFSIFFFFKDYRKKFLIKKIDVFIYLKFFGRIFFH